MACELSTADQGVTAAWSPRSGPSRGSRSVAERLTTFGIIGALHLVAVLAIWTRQLIVEPEPAPLFVNPIETVVRDIPPPPPLLTPSMSMPPVVLAPPLPPSIEVLEEAASAITAKEMPAEPPSPAPTVSGTITAARFDVDYLNNPAPAYPPLSRRLREEGVVVLKVLVRPDGSVAEATVNKRSGSMRLDDAALAAVKQWHFVPAKRGSEPIESWVFVPIEFELQS